MFITYDPDKNQRNIKDRNLNFDQAADLDWDKAWIYEDERNNYDELRFAAYSMLGKRLHFICFCETEEGIRVISFRKANNREVKHYEQQTID